MFIFLEALGAKRKNRKCFLLKYSFYHIFPPSYATMAGNSHHLREKRGLVKRSCIFAMVALNRRLLELKSEFRSNLLLRWTPGMHAIILLTHTRGRCRQSITGVFSSVPGCSFRSCQYGVEVTANCSWHVGTRLSPLIWSRQLYGGKELWKWPTTTHWQVLWPRPASRCFTPKPGSKILLVLTLDLFLLCLHASMTTQISISFSFFEPLNICLLSDHLWAAVHLSARPCLTVPWFSHCVA